MKDTTLFGDVKVSTPMIRQYFSIKEKHKDKLLLFRLGDFYELFGDDAYEASRILNIVLTSRNDLPMCGFPAHSAQNYIYKLVKSGYKVAICEQLEDASLAKGIVRRGVTQIITPGTITDIDILDGKSNNFLMGLVLVNNTLYSVFSDISTGEVFIEKIRITTKLEDLVDTEEGYLIKKEIRELLTKYRPSELLISSELLSKELVKQIFKEYKNITITSYPDWFFDKNECLKVFQRHANKVSLDLGEEEKYAIGSILRYFEETQLTDDISISSINFIDNRRYMEIDEFSIKNLELVSNLLDGSRKYTLLEVMDKTITPMGGRLLKKMILNPSVEVDVINVRLNKIEYFINNFTKVNEVRTILSEIADVERIATRISFKKVSQKELINLKNSIKMFSKLLSLLKDYSDLFSLSIPEGISYVYSLIDGTISEVISNFEEGGVIKDGVNEELDELRDITRNSKEYIEKIQERERTRTGITSLKVGYNKVMGFYIEVSKSNLHLVPKDYERKQTLVGAERFVTDELKELEYKFLSASEKISKIEKEIFEYVVSELSKYYRDLKTLSDVVSDIDVFSSLAMLAVENDYCKPQFVDSDEFIVEVGRHPVVESYLPKGEFVPNDTFMNNKTDRIMILTGPNMAGKSTYLRQNALIAIMAHVGSYVPAKRCRLGVIDKIFTRIGASDYLALGQSTFLVEMIEVSNILKNATPKSLIVMDEVGRGTSTYDGLSIAWAIIDYIANNPQKFGKTLFATHYHELTQLGDDEKRGIKNYTMAIREYKDEVIFLKKVIKGVANKSYGIFVAKLAGIPKAIIDLANNILKELEMAEKMVKEKLEGQISKGVVSKSVFQPSLFVFEMPNEIKEIISILEKVDINTLPPIESLKILSEIKEKLAKIDKI